MRHDFRAYLFFMETQPYSYHTVAGYAHSFNGRSVRASSLMGFLEECAAEHCRAAGKDIFSLHDDQKGWVLTGGAMRVFRYPQYGEELIVDTWISKWRTVSGRREYKITSSEGELLAEAGGRWVFWDLRNRRPSPIPAYYRDYWHTCSNSPYRSFFPDSDTPSIPEAISQQTQETTLKVRRGDIDLYGHLHNRVYIDWLMEAIPGDIYNNLEPYALGLRFYGEATLGDEVVFSSVPSEKGWVHAVRRKEDAKVLVRGFTEWNLRRQRLSA